MRTPASIVALLAVLALVVARSDRPSGPHEARAASARIAGPRPTPDVVAAGTRALARKVDKLRRRGPKPMAKPQDAAEFYLAQRLEAGETRLPLERLRTELETIVDRELSVPEGATQPGDIQSWSWIGPGNIGGRTRALVIDPDSPDTMIAAGVAGGIWKTVDGGASWNPADDLMLNLAVCSLAMDPQDPDVLYAGTGEGYFLSSVFVQGLGIFKSVDGGTTWSQLPGTVNGVPQGAFDFVNKVEVSPNDSNRVYAATRTGVWRSLDAGQTWSVVLANPQYIGGPSSSNGSTVGCTDLKIRTDRDPDVLFAAFGSLQSDGIFRSEDGGDTWLAYSVPANQGRTTIALAPSDQDVVYLLMADNGSVGSLGQLLNVFRSDDGGNSWTAQVDFGTATGPWLLSNLVLTVDCLEFEFPVYSQGWYDNIIAVDPTDPDMVWVGGVDIFRSDDGGVNWQIPGYWFFGAMNPPPPYQIHADHHLIVFHPDYDGVANQTMIVTNDGGIFRTQNARAATSLEICPLPGTLPLPEIVWERLNNGYGVTQFYHGDSAKGVDVFVGGAQDNGTNRAQTAGSPNSWDRIFGGDGGYVAIDPTDSQTMYIEYQDFPSIQKSTDGGDTFVEAFNGITDTGLFITPFTMDQNDPQVLWTGGTRPWRTTDGAGLWTAAGPDFAGPDTITAIAIAPSDSNVVYLGFTNGYVARTTNGLSPNPTWQVFVNGLSAAFVSSIAVDPIDPDLAYLTYSNFGVPHVLRTVDGGQSWSSIDGIGFAGIPDIPVHWIEIRPCNPQQLYAGTELGVFASDDGGASWLPANLGLAHTVVESLDFQSDDKLVAFTHGRGAFVATLDPCPGAGPGTPVCFGDLSCPCLNVDLTAGCNNSTLSGALLSATGSASVSADDAVLTISGAPLDGNGLIFNGPSIVAPFVPAGSDGYACTGGGIRYPGILADGSGTLSQATPVAEAAAAGLFIAAGETWHFQGWYRDNAPSPCGGNNNLSNAYSITFVP